MSNLYWENVSPIYFEWTDVADIESYTIKLTLRAFMGSLNWLKVNFFQLFHLISFADLLKALIPIGINFSL